jgi:hypothetical protein
MVLLIYVKMLTPINKIKISLRINYFIYSLIDLC